MSRILVVAACSALLGGCTFDERIDIRDLKGRVVVPREAATKTFMYNDGTEQTVTDVRLIGPVVLGLYPEVESGLQEYSHPSVGPEINERTYAYPYGGTTVGDIRYPCVEFLACKHVAGRYPDFDSIIEWFRDIVRDPVVDDGGREIDNGDYLRQICYDLLEVTSDEEVRLTGEPQFVENGDGDFEAEFTIWQQEFVEGFSLWGWMDAPSESGFFSTCNTRDGQSISEYDSQFFGGTQYLTLLNLPSEFIAAGDWVAGFGGGDTYQYKWTDPADELVIRLDTLVEN